MGRNPGLNKDPVDLACWESLRRDSERGQSDGGRPDSDRIAWQERLWTFAAREHCRKGSPIFAVRGPSGKDLAPEGAPDRTY
jgi:hypothetical protein